MYTKGLDAYFHRIGYDGPREASLETLRRLTGLQPAAIPFEAIDVLLGRGVNLDPRAVDDKLITRRRGGYCFEQNSLLKRMLCALGFQVEGLIGRVWWNLPQDAPPRDWSHMVLRVMVDGVPYLVDSGFGGCTPTAPLRFDRTGPQPTLHENFRIIPTEIGWLLEAQLGQEWARVYEFSDRICANADYERANRATSTQPDSLFRRELIVSRSTRDARILLQGNRFTIRRRDAATEQRRLSAQELKNVLIEVYELPFKPDWQPIIEAAAQSQT